MPGMMGKGKPGKAKAAKPKPSAKPAKPKRTSSLDPFMSTKDYEKHLGSIMGGSGAKKPKGKGRGK